MNHVEQVKEQLSRMPRELPYLQIIGNPDIDNIDINNFVLKNYNPYPSIKAEVTI